ncbi:ABC transporter ATP-binding protein [Streptomyces aureocirculatus]|uniref:ABC transporter ATP-binding protein n=1 Tax=Streptomyces aureocirculatus TaxID=67275 RepID=UPI0018FEA893|nr:ABC transporter ATP-binding protein [Streptomyces aureocirculatus]
MAVVLRGLVKEYGAVRAVAGIDLTIPRGACFGLLGPNGAGKTTTMEIVSGLLEPTSGQVRVLGRNWSSQRRELRKRVGVAFQQTHLPEKLTVVELLRLFQSFYREGPDVDTVLEAVALTESRTVRYDRLSGGQQQRVALGCALMGRPELLLLDEPTAGLDTQARLQLWELLRRLRAEENRTIVLTTHYMDEAERLCDGLAVIDHGRIVAQGRPEELICEVASDGVIEFSAPGPVPLDRLAALPGIRSARSTPQGYALRAADVPSTVQRVLACLEDAGTQPSTLSIRRSTLEDVFLTLTGRHLRD